MKKLFALLLVVFLFGGSTIAFAVWDQLETTSDVVEISVGEGVVISVTLDDETEGNLIPEDAVLKEDDVKEVKLEFVVELDQDDLEETLNLKAIVQNLKIDDSDTNADLVNVDVPEDLTIKNDEVEITLTVTLEMPEDSDQYEAIKNQNITFDVFFEATRQE